MSGIHVLRTTRPPGSLAHARDDKRLFLWALLAFALIFSSRSLLALDVPSPPTQWYTDTASLLDPSQASALNEKLRAFEQQSGAQFIIYVFPSLEGEALEDFTIRCAEKWKVGNKKYDNGLILFVFVKEKKIRIEVGYGLEGTITDAFSSDVIRNTIAPYFKQSNYAGGLNAAADAIIAKIRGGEAPVPPTSPGASGRPVQVSGGSNVTCSPVLIFFVIIFLLIVLPAILMPNRRHGCGGCLLPFFLWPSGGSTFGGGGFGGGGWGGGGGFSGGGGSFGGGGASGGW